MLYYTFHTAVSRTPPSPPCLSRYWVLVQALKILCSLRELTIGMGSVNTLGQKLFHRWNKSLRGSRLLRLCENFSERSFSVSTRSFGNRTYDVVLPSRSLRSCRHLFLQVYLTLNKIAPEYEGCELGIGDSIIMKVSHFASLASSARYNTACESKLHF